MFSESEAMDVMRIKSQNENLVSNQATNNEVTRTDISLQDQVTAKECDTN